jgi:hypothetical protein
MCLVPQINGFLALPITWSKNIRLDFCLLVTQRATGDVGNVQEVTATSPVGRMEGYGRGSVETAHTNYRLSGHTVSFCRLNQLHYRVWPLPAHLLRITGGLLYT